MSNYPIREYMTPLPVTIDAERSLRETERKMRELGVRHLPVTRGGELVGVISDRDLRLLSSLDGVDPERAAVGSAMTEEPYAVAPDVSLPVVATNMADQKVGCALVVEQGQVVGILTTTDALRLLASLVSFGPRAVPPSLFPSAVRKRILREHEQLRGALSRCERLAERLREGDPSVQAELQTSAEAFLEDLLGHMQVEDAILAPALRELPVSGAGRADALLHKHEEQREQVRDTLDMLKSGSIEHLPETLLLLAHAVRTDMTSEEKQLLTESVLRDDPVQIDATGG